MNTISKISTVFAAALLILGTSVSAKAATLSYFVEFTATGFDSGAPVDPVIGSFTINLDPTLTYHNSTNITLHELNMPLGSDLAFDYFGSSLRVGGMAGGVDGVTSFTDDFWVSIDNFTTAPSFVNVFYSTANTSDIYFSSAGSLTVAPVPVPLPFALFASGLGLMGLFGWCKKRQARAVA